MGSESGPVMIHGKDKSIQPRRLHSWIDSFLRYTEVQPSPEIYRRWSAIGAITGALERRTWIDTSANRLYPNMFVALVGPPGTGKDSSIVAAKDLLARTGMVNLAPISMSHKGMMDHLADETTHKTMLDLERNEWLSYHSLLCFVPEIGVLLPKYDLGYLSMLNELFQCYDIFEERIRQFGGVLRIERPHIHIFGGTQPKYMEEWLPDAAFGMGFTARMVFVYHGAPVKVSVFNSYSVDETLEKNLIFDLANIARLKGPFKVRESTAKLIEEWHHGPSEDDKPTHSKLVHYNARRIMHVLKLSMAYSTARSNEMIIEDEDFQAALGLLLETESYMPEIFKEMKSGGQLAELEEAFHHLLALYHQRGQKPVPEHMLVHFLSARVPANQIEFLIETMIRSRMVEVVEVGNPGLNLPRKYQDRAFIPLALNVVEEGQKP